LIPPLPVRDDGKGRPWKPTREVLNGILWVMRTGAPWKDMPGRYPPYATCHRRFSGWVRNGTLRKIVEPLARDLREPGKLDPEEAFVDGTFAGGKKGLHVSKTKRKRCWRRFFAGASSDAPSTCADYFSVRSSVIGVIDVQAAKGTHDSGVALLRERAGELGADAVVSVEFHRGDAGHVAHASGLGVRYQRGAGEQNRD
jgi:transposase